MGPQSRRNYFRLESDLSELIRSSVGANTFRAFAHLAQKPSEIFREWADAYFTQQRFKKLSRMTNQLQYDQFLNDALAELADYWFKRGGQPLRLGAGRKLINLLLKSILRFTSIDASARKTLTPLFHIPHDLFCLAALRCSASSGRFGITLNIPKNASMGFINSRSQYQTLQELARRIAAKAAEPRISIDLVAWDHAH